MTPKLTPLSPGDTIDIIAPSFVCTQEEVEAATLYLRALGYTPHIPYDMVSTAEPYHSQTDEVRLGHLKNALLSEDSKAVWCLRGGYGAARLLAGLQGVTPLKRPKWVIGFSDITAIHAFIVRYWRWPVVHGPMLSRLSTGKIAKISEEITLALLSGETKELAYTLQPLNAAARKEQTIRAPITGGNLSLVQTSIGTFWQIDITNAILFLEEFDEKGYAIDRMLLHLQQAGVLNKVKAVIIGDCDGTEQESPNIAYAIQRFADNNAHIPVLRVKGMGHGDTNNPLLFGVPFTLTTGEGAMLKCEGEEFYG